MKSEHSILQAPYEYAYKHCHPIFTTFEITQHCNLKCRHCYNFDRSKRIPEEVVSNQLSDEKILGVIEELAKLKGLYLNFSGGEALLHPGIFSFIKKASEVNLLPRLKSNGILLTDETVARLKDAGLNSVDVGLYGCNAETYEAFIGGGRFFEEVLKGLDNLKKHDMETSISIIIHRGNADQLEEMISLCEQRNLSYQISTEVTERYDQSKGARDHEITPAQFEELLLGPQGSRFMADNRDHAKQCSCARSVCGISSTGTVYPCIGAPIPAGDLREKSFEWIWNNSPVLKSIRGIRDEDFKSCNSCDYIETCNRSSGTIYLNTGEYAGRDDSTLEQAKIRYRHREKFNV